MQLRRLNGIIKIYSLNPKEGIKIGKREQGTDGQIKVNSKLIDYNLTISPIMLHLNSLQTPSKRKILSHWVKSRPNQMLFRRSIIYLKILKHIKVKKNWEILFLHLSIKKDKNLG